MRARPANPYHGRSLEYLGDALQRRASELLTPQPRSPDQRKALAADTAYLLLTAAAAITPGHSVADAPERDLSTTVGLAEGFERWFDRLVVAARHRVLARAANAALGGRAQAWMRDGVVEGARAYDLAMGSDDGLRRVLLALERTYLAGQER